MTENGPMSYLSVFDRYEVGTINGRFRDEAKLYCVNFIYILDTEFLIVDWQMDWWQNNLIYSRNFVINEDMIHINIYQLFNIGIDISVFVA